MQQTRAIKQKLASYWHAYEHADEGTVFPQVLFIAPDADRAKELRYIVAQGDEEAQALFMVSTVGEFAGLYFS